MKYSYHRDASHVIDLGYKSDDWSTLVIKAVSEPEFTTISEKLPGIDQFNKDVMTLSEVTPTFNSYSTIFSDSLGAETIPTVEIETRSGMFEYLFMWIDYPPQAVVAFPKTHPLFKVWRGTRARKPVCPEIERRRYRAVVTRQLSQAV